MKTERMLLGAFITALFINDAIAFGTILLPSLGEAVPDFTRALILFCVLSLCMNFAETAVFLVILRRKLSGPISRIVRCVKDGGAQDSGERSDIIGDIESVSTLIESYCEEKNTALHGVVELAARVARNEDLLTNDMDRAHDGITEHNTLNGIIAGKMHYQNNFINMTAEQSEKVNALWKNLDALLTSQSAAVRDSSGSVLRMIGNIAGISKASDYVNGFAEDLLDNSRTGGEIIKKSLESMDSIGAMSAKLNEAANIIADTASKIDLLSINASIEAVHAAGFGKGFSVVAKEIKTLATKTAESAKSIIAYVRENTTTIHATSKIAEEARCRFNEIFGGVTMIVDSIKEIKNSIHEESENGRRLDGTIAQMNRITTEIQGSANMMKETVDSLSMKLSELKDVARETLGTSGIMDTTLTKFQKSIDDASRLLDENSGHMERIGCGTLT